jgi:hypothetical protein
MWIALRVFLLIRTLMTLCTYLWLLSPLLDNGRFFSFLILYTVGKTPWTGDQPVARPLPKRRTTQTQNKRTKTSMPWVGFEPTIPAFKRANTVHVVHRAATVICVWWYNRRKPDHFPSKHTDISPEFIQKRENSSSPSKYIHLVRIRSKAGSNRHDTRGADKSLALERTQQATGLKKCIYSYIFPPKLHTLITSLF